MFLWPAFVLGNILSSVPQTLHTSELMLQHKENKIIYEVEEALTPQQKQIGLMYREQMPQNHGMVFYNEEPKPMAMWMKNTYIPLDMLFADKNGKIVCIFTDTKPHSLETLTCDKDVALTLELNAGQVSLHKIELGDRIVHHLLEDSRTNENK